MFTSFAVSGFIENVCGHTRRGVGGFQRRSGRGASSSAASAVLAVRPDLFEVVPVRTGDGVVVELKSDRPLHVRAFTLPDPRRLVLDLDGVINHVARRLMPVNAPLVSQVRVAQFQATPETGDAGRGGSSRPGRLSASVKPPPARPFRSARMARFHRRSRESVQVGQTGIIDMHRSHPESAPEPEPAEEVVSALFDLPEESTPAEEVTDQRAAGGPQPRGSPTRRSSSSRPRR